jgi:small-conductance mechanosensitive channel
MARFSPRFLFWLVVVLTVGSSPIRAQTPAAPITAGPTASLPQDLRAFDVTVWNRKLVQFRSTLDFPDVATRAKSAVSRIEFLLEENLNETVRVQFSEVDGKKLARLYCGPHLVFALADTDLKPLKNESLEAAADRVRVRLDELFQDHAAQQSLPRTLRGAAEAAITLALFAVFWLLVARIRNAIVARVHARVHGTAKIVSVFGYDVRAAVFTFAESLCRVLALGLLIAVGYVALTFALARFPYTRPWSEQLRTLFFDSAAGLARDAVQAIPNLLSVLIIFWITRGLTRILGGWFASIEAGHGRSRWLDPEAARATRRLLVIGMWIFAVTVAFPYLPGSHSEAFRGISVLVGLMVTLGGSGFVGQIIGGLAAIYTRSVRTGDYITIGEVSGVVREVGMLSTKIMTRTREEVTLPNAMLISTAIRNHSRSGADGVALSTSVTIGYDTPWRQVEAMLKTAADRTDGLVRSLEPKVQQTALDDFYVRYELTVFAATAEIRADTASRLHGCVQDVFNEFGVQIMSPHFRRQPATPVTVPKEKWHQPPAQSAP